MLTTLFSLANVGLVCIVVWVGLTIAFILPRTNAHWIPFWFVVELGLMAAWVSARQWQRSPNSRRHRLAAWMAAIPCGLFGLWLVIANEVQGQRHGDWEGYLTLLGGGLILHALLWIVELVRSRRAQA